MNSKLIWYSTKLRFVCIIESEGATRYEDSIYICQAIDFEQAFFKALELGKKREEKYLNVDDKKVVWKFKEIITLDQIHNDCLDGSEIYSESKEINEGEKYTIETIFYPEESQPNQTV